MGVVADFHWAHTVVGSELDAVRFAFKNKNHILFNCDPHFHSYQPSCSEFDSTLEETWAKTSYRLYQEGKNPFSNTIKTLRIDRKEKLVKVFTKNEMRSLVGYDKLYIFDLENVLGVEDVFSQEILRYRVLDWFDVHTTGGKVDVESLEDLSSDFIKKISFFDSTRIDGSRAHKDIVAESILTLEQINDVNYTDTIARFKIIEQLKQIGIEKPNLRLWKRDIYPIKKICGENQNDIFLMGAACQHK